MNENTNKSKNIKIGTNISSICNPINPQAKACSDITTFSNIKFDKYFSLFSSDSLHVIKYLHFLSHNGIIILKNNMKPVILKKNVEMVSEYSEI